MAGRKEYQLAIKIAGEIERSLPASMRKTKSELRAISKTAAASSIQTSKSMKSMGDSIDKVNSVSNKVIKTLGKMAKVYRDQIHQAMIMS